MNECARVCVGMCACVGMCLHQALKILPFHDHPQGQSLDSLCSLPSHTGCTELITVSEEKGFLGIDLSHEDNLS